MFLENPSALFRYDYVNNGGAILVFKETLLASTYMANLRTTALYVWDEVYLSGFHLDSGSVSNYFVVSFNPGPTAATAMLTKHRVGLTGCTNVEMGPFVPLSPTSIFMGVSVKLCSSIYTMVIHRYSGSFATPDKIVGNSSLYQRPEMAVAG